MPPGSDMTMIDAIRRLLFPLLLLSVSAPAVVAQVKQPREVIDAYRVCNEFQSLLSRDLDFSRAFESTFAKSLKRRRAIALRDGEFDGDLTSVDSITLIRAYKARMQLIYLMLPLASPDSNEQELLFFPPEIKALFKRQPPESTSAFSAYAAQLENDATTFRAHLNRLAALYPDVAERIREFKTQTLSVKLSPPERRVVTPLYGPGGGRAVRDREPYYEFDGYTVVREGKQMKIVSIRFFTRLF